MLGKAMHTLVMVPAMMSCFFPVALTATTKSGLSQALISPRRATYFAWGANSWISGISGPFGPCGTDAVVMTGSFASVATLASVVTLARSVVIGMSPMVWNRPLWWSISSMAAFRGSRIGLAPLKFAGALMRGLLGIVRYEAEQSRIPGSCAIETGVGKHGTGLLSWGRTRPSSLRSPAPRRARSVACQRVPGLGSREAASQERLGPRGGHAGRSLLPGRRRGERHAVTPEDLDHLRAVGRTATSGADHLGRL